LFLSCAGSSVIIDKPINFNSEREELSLQYLQEHYGLAEASPAIVPRMIVLHYTVIPTMQGTYATFYPPYLPDTRPDISNAGNLNVSAHFLVDRDGTIYRLMPETLMARHVIGLNHCAIGIENVGGTEKLPLTGDQVRANVWLIQYLAGKYDIEYVIGHSEYTLFEGHELWLEKDEGYRTLKNDPGEAFMRKVRRRLKNLNFKPLPSNPTNDE
jgi:N-acetyl-anhydromuramyl-L-alanine amidase AmpD